MGTYRAGAAYVPLSIGADCWRHRLSDSGQALISNSYRHARFIAILWPDGKRSACHQIFMGSTWAVLGRERGPLSACSHNPFHVPTRRRHCVRLLHQLEDRGAFSVSLVLSEMESKQSSPILNRHVGTGRNDMYWGYHRHGLDHNAQTFASTNASTTCCLCWLPAANLSQVHSRRQYFEAR
jgi:hypothetical protein